MSDGIIALTALQFKRCNGCDRDLPMATEFFSRRGNRPIGFVSKCHDCRRVAHNRWANENRSKQQALQSRAYYRKQYGEDIVPKKMSPEYRKKTKEEVLSEHRRYLDKDRQKETSERWRKSNPSRVAAMRRRARVKRNLNPTFVTADRMRASMGSSLRHQGREGKRRRSWEDLVGYSIHDLMTHIERQFTKGMTWEKYLNGEIHLDHIVPIAAFSFTSASDPDFKACWALTNLRPIWRRENQRKHARRLFLL